MKAMPLDYFIAWMLTHRYDVDVRCGRVVNSRTGRALRAFPNRDGYPSVNLVFCRTVVRRATVHRMVAIKLWGAIAVRHKQVAHLDGDEARSHEGNLCIAPSAKAHVYFDGTHRNLTYRAARKATWPPCARCNDAHGRITDGGVTPDRISGQRFGIDGDLCRRCYGTLQERERRARKRQRSAA